jgi:hypothetical protein
MQVSPIPGVHLALSWRNFADSVDELFPLSSIGPSSRGSRKPFREQKQGQNFSRVISKCTENGPESPLFLRRGRMGVPFRGVERKHLHSFVLCSPQDEARSSSFTVSRGITDQLYHFGQHTGDQCRTQCPRWGGLPPFHRRTGGALALPDTTHEALWQP